MATTSEIPVIVRADAEERIRELGTRREFEAMLEHAKQTMPGLLSIEASQFFDELSAPRLLIVVCKDSPRPEDDDSAGGNGTPGWSARSMRRRAGEPFL